MKYGSSNLQFLQFGKPKPETEQWVQIELTNTNNWSYRKQRNKHCVNLN